MNITNLKYFVCVAQQLNITKAADSLHISQQALSSQIAKLESELNTKLFTRKPELALTLDGQKVYQFATTVLNQQQALLEELDVSDSLTQGSINLGISYTRGQAILPLILPPFLDKYPNVEISVVEESTTQLESQLKNGNIDLLIGFSPFKLDNVEAKELIKDNLTLIVSDNLLNKYYGKESKDKLKQYQETSDIKVFKELPFILLKKGERIREAVDEQFKKRKIDPYICLETRNIQTAFALASQGMGATFYPSMYLLSESTLHQSETIHILPFKSSGLTDSIAIAYYRNHYLNNISKAFIENSVEVFKKLEEDNNLLN